MTSKQLKRYLFNNPAHIITILEELGCHSIKHINNKRVMGARPCGDNPTSIQVLLTDENLTTLAHTEREYNGGDIFSFISHMKNCNFRNSLMFICRLLNIEYTRDFVKPTTNETYNFLRSFTKSNHKGEDASNIKLEENILDSYIRCAHQKFLDDNLTVESQYKFGIHYDIHQRRILIPIRDLDGALVTIKGRTVVEDYYKKDIMKYIAYYEYYARFILYGYYENYWDILTNDEVILVESEKAVIQADGYGVNNIVALSKKKITDEQLFKLISFNKNIVLALDKDVPLEELEKIAEEFKGLCKVYAIYDMHDLLTSKQSPFDAGGETWDKLYENKIRII